MDELASYHLSDFILFSQSTYFRLFELYNQVIWPLHILAIIFACLIVYALWKKSAWAGRFIAAILVLSWSWVAVAFLYQRFYQIHVVANVYALSFIVQALLILWYGIIKNKLTVFSKSNVRIKAGSVLLLLSLSVYPFIALISGRNWQQFEMFALAPDPTALATIAVLIFYKLPLVLYIIPVLWLLISAITLSVM